jgi:hypothetical protein
MKMNLEISPLTRKSGETEKQYYKRMRSENVKDRNLGVVLHDSSRGTYRKPDTKTPQFTRSTSTKRVKPLSKFIAFRKVRKFIGLLNMSVWVTA